MEHSYVKLQPSESRGTTSRKGTLYIDLDGLFKPLTENDRPKYPSEIMEKLPATLSDVHRVSQLHFLMRNAVVRARNVSDHESLSKWSRITLFSAVVHNYDRDAFLELPDWLTFFSYELKNSVAERYPGISEITLKADLRPRMYAWSIPDKREVYISALTRELLLRINVFVLNFADEIIRNPDCDTAEWVAAFVDYLLAYVATSFYDLNYSRLPVVRPGSQSTFLKALGITQLQVEFMIAHEFAHIVMDFPGRDFHQIEDDCDKFALYGLASIVSDLPDLYMALRWLFHVVAIERAVGEALYCESGELEGGIDWRQEEVLARVRSQDFEEVSACISDYRSLPELMGSVLFLSTRELLENIGPSEIRARVEGIRAELHLPSPERFAEIALMRLYEHYHNDESGG